VVAGTEWVEYAGDAIDIIEQLTDGSAPGGRVREHVVGGDFEAIGKLVLQLDGQAVVDRTIVGAEQRNGGRIDRNSESGGVFVAAILVHALLVLVGEVDAPVVSEGVLKAGTGG